MAPTSPVKRVTRAAAKKNLSAPVKDGGITKTKSVRRKAVPDATVEVDSMETANPKSATCPAAKLTHMSTTARRRLKVVPLDTVEITTSKKPKTTAKSRQMSALSEEAELYREPETFRPVAPKPKRGGRSATSAAEVEKESAPAAKSRGRPKKTAVPDKNDTVEIPPTTRQTRARSGSEAVDVEDSASIDTKKSAGTRKKVTFQDLPESDKENQPIRATRAISKKAPTPIATGMRAKPIRRTANGASRKAVVSSTRDTKDGHVSQPLSPKKITQVAKSISPAESEDELNGGKTPVRDLSLSPRRLPSALKKAPPVKKLDFTPALISNPSDNPHMMSPPRRPPQSPLKDMLKESPRRGEPIPVFALSASKPSIAGSLGISAPQPQPALLQSPKRGTLDSSAFSQSTIKSQRSPLKPTLLQTPAKRLFSPSKQKTQSATSAKATAGVSRSPQKPTDAQSSETAVSCHFRASMSPERSGRVHRLSDEEMAMEAIGELDFDQSVLNIRSPVKLPPKQPDYAISQAPDSLEPATIQNDLVAGSNISLSPEKPAEMIAEDMLSLMAQNSDLLSEPEPGEGILAASMDIGTTARTGGNPITVDMASLLFHSSRFRDDDESSEDELQADTTPDRRPQMGRPSLTAAGIRSRLSSGISSSTNQMGFTPLAHQLSTWSTKSPGKQAAPNRIAHGMFSPLATQHVPGEVQISRQSTPQTMKSVGSRESIVGKASKGSRFSLELSMAINPEVSSYFEDEMEVMELEDDANERNSTEQAAPGADDEPDHDDTSNFEVENSQYIAHKSQPAGLADFEVIEDYFEKGGELTLTTDLINQETYTETALVDCAAIAREAEGMAPEHIQNMDSSFSSTSVYGDENAIVECNTATSLEFGNAPDVLHSTADLEDPPANQSGVIGSPDISFADITTPVRPDLSLPRFVNTVISKVPLRPEGDISPIKVQKKRSRSFSAGASPSKKPCFDITNISKGSIEALLSPERTRPTPSRTPVRNSRRPAVSPATSVARTTPGQMSFVVDDFGDSTLDGIELPEDSISDTDDCEESVGPAPGLAPTPLTNIRSIAVTTSNRSPLKAVGGVLHGAVVYVDVHTTEGADASGIFVDLLTEMGARCVREWRWNPRASIPVDCKQDENAYTPGKPGITHVVYKDGGKRTLEKVRDANESVWCVGVAWVLDCERQKKWLDESVYSVDTSLMPRGGSRRRKSMEPKALLNANGNLTATKQDRRSVSAELFTQEMKAELVRTPVRNPAPLVHVPHMEEQGASLEGNDDDSSAASTPRASEPVATPTGYVSYDPSTSMSPTTPYLMGQGSKLVQQSCPPKQSQQGLFPVTGRIEDQVDEGVRRRLEAARRRTMNWRPRIASPLSR